MFISSGKRYTEEFKIEAVKQVTERGYSVAEVAERLGTTTHSLYAWLKRYGEQSPQQISKADSQAEIAQLKAELRRVTEERDILKKAPQSILPATPSKVRLVHRVAKIMQKNKLKAQIGYKRRYVKGSKTATIVGNILNRNFNPTMTNKCWVSDITYVRTYEGF